MAASSLRAGSGGSGARRKERGLLEARQDEEDRRSLRLHLTHSGQAADLVLRRQARRLSGVAIEGFSEQEREQLFALLERVRRNLEEAEEG